MRSTYDLKAQDYDYCIAAAYLHCLTLLSFLLDPWHSWRRKESSLVFFLRRPGTLCCLRLLPFLNRLTSVETRAMTITFLAKDDWLTIGEQ